MCKNARLAREGSYVCKKIKVLGDEKYDNSCAVSIRKGKKERSLVVSRER